MALARKCIRCKRTFLAKKDERYCKHCAEAEILAIVKKGTTENNPEPRLATCKKCGKLFEQNRRGRPSVNCPTCKAENISISEKWSKKIPKPKNILRLWRKLQ